METVPNTQKNELISNFEEKKQNDLDQKEINEILTRYYIWFMNKNNDEIQTVCRFWNQIFINQTSIFMEKRP